MATHSATVTESEPRWSLPRLRGGRGDSDRIFMLCFVLVFCGALVTGIVGSTLYAVKTNSNAKLRATRCKALQLFLIPLRCGQETCDKDPVTAQQVCSIKMVDCFAPQWRVEFTQVDSEGEEMQHKSVNSWINDSPYLSQVTAERMMAKHPVSSSAVCTYDSSDPNHVVWGYDDPQPWLIAMIVAWCVVGLFVCVLGFGWFFARETGV